MTNSFKFDMQLFAVTVANPGQINGAGDRLAQFLKNFGGETITAFERHSKTLGRHMERTIESGKSASFPVLGRTVANYLKPGDSLDDIRKNIKGTEVIILIDGLLTASCLITDIDEAISHFDVRVEYSFQLGEALAFAADGATLAEMAKMVVTVPTDHLTEKGLPKTFDVDLSLTEDAISATNGNAYMEALLKAQLALNLNHVPEADRTAYCTPEVVTAMVNAKVVINSDYANNGTINEGANSVLRIAGFDIIQCPDLTAGGASATDILQGDGHVFPTSIKDTCKIIACHRSAVGTLKLKDLALEHARRAEYQADMVVAKYAMGHKGLRPEAVMLVTASKKGS